MSGRFADKVAFVVGAAQGIGRATAAAFASEGAALALADVDESVKSTLADLEQAHGVEGAAWTLDVRDPERCQQVSDEVAERFGHIDATAVVAGVIHDALPVHELPVDEWDRVLGVNLSGPFNVARSVVPHIIEQQGGSIVTIASWWGRSGHAFYSAYCTSKAGLVVLTQCLADELAQHGARANTICPGNINTSMHKQAIREEAAARGISEDEMRDIEWGKIPLGKAGDPQDIADAVVFLSSDDAKYITGASLDVNGGVLYH